ncbi:MAG: hypothetical protein RI841_07100 [Halomonas sp.]|nr:hypothetical protein [Halomonas sp.]MDR9439248.1 hypothetical protein [Halomonas sp.]
MSLLIGFLLVSLPGLCNNPTAYQPGKYRADDMGRTLHDPTADPGFYHR